MQCGHRWRMTCRWRLMSRCLIPFFYKTVCYKKDPRFVMRLKRFMQARGFKKWDTWRTFQNRRRRRGLLFRFRIGGGCILCCCTCCRIFVRRLCSDAFVGRFRIRRGICGSILRQPILVLGQRQTWRQLR